MATLGTAATTAPSLPTTYQELYTSHANALDSHYGRFYSAFHSITGNTADELFDTFVSSTQRVPKILLARVQMADHTQRIVTLHRPSMYEHDLVEPAPAWNYCTIAFMSDTTPHSRFIATVIFPVTAFTVTAAQTVPRLAAMDPLVQASTSTTIGPFTSGLADIKDITTRNLMLVPPRYADIVFGKT